VRVAELLTPLVQGSSNCTTAEPSCSLLYKAFFVILHAFCRPHGVSDLFTPFFSIVLHFFLLPQDEALCSLFLICSSRKLCFDSELRRKAPGSLLSDFRPVPDPSMSESRHRPSNLRLSDSLADSPQASWRVIEKASRRTSGFFYMALSGQRIRIFQVFSRKPRHSPHICLSRKRPPLKLWLDSVLGPYLREPAFSRDVGAPLSPWADGHFGFLAMYG